MIVRVQTVDGVAAVDLEEELVLGLETDKRVEPAPSVSLPLPRIVAAAASGSTVVAVVDARPPLLVSHDGGRTWRDSGRGLPGDNVRSEHAPTRAQVAARARDL